jgi:hypothetical protein
MPNPDSGFSPAPGGEASRSIFRRGPAGLREWGGIKIYQVWVRCWGRNFIQVPVLDFQEKGFPRGSLLPVAKVFSAMVFAYRKSYILSVVSFLYFSG